MLQRQTLNYTAHLEFVKTPSKTDSLLLLYALLRKISGLKPTALMPCGCPDISVLQDICRRGFSSFQRSSPFCVLPTWSIPTLLQLSLWVAVDGIPQCHKSVSWLQVQDKQQEQINYRTKIFLSTWQQWRKQKEKWEPACRKNVPISIKWRGHAWQSIHHLQCWGKLELICAQLVKWSKEE